MLHLILGGYIMLFLIQWIGGVYCLSDGDLKNSDILMWGLCVFIGWVFILIWIIDWFSNSSTSTNTESIKIDTPPEQAQSEQNSQSNTLAYDYEEEFKNIGKYANAGVALDLKRYIIEGGGFWYAGDVVRHLGGKNNVYQTYYNRIESAFSHQSREEAAKIAAEAAEYARQKEDILQFWGFLFEEALFNRNINRIVNISINVCDYCIEQGKKIPPKWFYENGLLICNIHYLALKITDNPKTKDNFTALFDTTTFLIDADKKFECYDRLEEDFYYLGLLAGHMDRFKKANATSAEINQSKNELLSMIKSESSNYNALVKRWEKEGVSFR